MYIRRIINSVQYSSVATFAPYYVIWTTEKRLIWLSGPNYTKH